MNDRLRHLLPRGLAALVVVLGVVAYVWHRRHVAPKPKVALHEAASQRPTPVYVTPVVVQDVPVWLEGLGTVTAYQQVLVRSQVDGYLAEVRFREGQYVRRGDPLVQIDPRRFQAALHQAEGALWRDRSQLEVARRNLDRFARLREGDLAAETDVDVQRSTVGQLEGLVRADEAAIESARLDLGFANIVSPIDGVLGVRLVDRGNLVHASDATGLVVVTQIEPIAIFFTMPQDYLDEVALAMSRGAPDVEVYARDGSRLLDKGTLAVIDNQIVATTSTIRLKAIAPNPDHVLWPNQFVRARVLVDVRHHVLVVPTIAVGRGPEGNFVYVVDDRSVATARPVTVSGTASGLSILTEGLREGERVVVEGQNLLRNGSRVQVQAPRAPASPGGTR